MTSGRPETLRLLLVWALLETLAAAQVRRDQESLLAIWARAAARPIVVAAETVDRTLRALGEGLGDTLEMASELTRLRAELDESRARIRLLEQDRAVLEEAIEVAAALPGLETRCLVARCTWRDLGQGLMEVSAGTAEGVRPDVVAVAAEGVIGRVIRVGRHASWVELVTRPTAAVAVRTADGAAEGLAVGTGGAALRVEYLPRRAELVRGTELLTTGADGVYPPGLPVATVTRVREVPEAFLEVTAEPGVDLGRVRVVGLLLGWPGGGELR